MDAAMKRIILSVVFTTIIVVLSIPLWLYSSGSKGTVIANGTKSMDIAVEVGTFDSLFVIEEERALAYVKPTTISLRNRNEEKREFELLFVVDKESTVPFEQVVVSLNENIYKLKNRKMFQDEKSYYFILEKITLDAYSEIDKSARIWLNEAEKDIDESAILKTNFITR